MIPFGDSKQWSWKWQTIETQSTLESCRTYLKPEDALKSPTVHLRTVQGGVLFTYTGP